MPILTPFLELYSNFNLLPLDELHSQHNQQITLLVFKCLNYAHLLPPVYTNYFVLNAEVHDYNTRASTDLRVLGPISTYGQRCTKNKRSALWNRLPAKIKLPSSILFLNIILKSI